MRLRTFFFCLVLAAGTPCVSRAAADPASLVDPFVGTSGTKAGGPIDTFPGAGAPFGMLQFSPDTPSQPAGGGYDYKDRDITGFSLDHLSGPGCSVYGDFGIEPVAGDVSDPAHVKQPFSHSDERATAGYYSVTIGREQISVELTAGSRSGIARFTFPASPAATILVNASSNQAGVNDSSIRVLSPTQMEGWAKSGQFCGMPDVYTVYFAAQFDRPMTSSGVWGEGHGTQAGAWGRFSTAAGDRTVTVRVALSWTGQDGAWANLRAGLPDFDAQRAQTAQRWNDFLHRVDVTGGTDGQQRTFYTALYHALLHPNLYSDADGRYRGFDNAVHRVRTGHDEYATFSGWDIYRTQVPLIALLAPNETSDMMQSLVDAAHQGGWLPKWPLANGYSGVMGGDPAATMLAGASAFGARNFDRRGALQAMLKNALDGTSPAGQGWYRPRPGLEEYDTLGYVVNTHTTNVSPVPNGASLTLEYAQSDFSIAQFARSLGSMAAYREFMGRAQRWRNVFDTRTGSMAPRDRAGAFVYTPIASSGQSGFQEGNAVQYTWMVPHDLSALIYGMGGPAAAVSRLDAYFTQLNAGPDKPYAWLGNEPSLGDPWVYLSAEQPSKAERIVHEALTTLYGDSPDGIPGNDDLGTMSAWYVWCALGLYPQNPAVPILDLGTPMFTSARIAVPHGARIEIDAPAAGERGSYVQSVAVNGRAEHASWVPFSAKDALRIAFSLGDAPSAWATSPRDVPPSYAITMPRFPPSTSASFSSGERSIALEPGGKAEIHVTLAGADPSHPDLVSWRVVLPRGLTASPDAGTAAADGAIRIELHADASMPAQYYPLTIAATARNGAILQPWEAAVRIARAGARIPLGYVANFSDNTVSAFDPQTGTVAQSIPVGNNPGDVALTPDGSRLLVPNQGSNTISVVDTEKARVIATIKTGKVPASVRIAPDGATAWVTDFGDNAVQAIDLARLSAGPFIPAGRQPQQLAFAPGGKILYVADQGDNAVTPVDVQTGKPLQPIAVGARPVGIAIAKDGTAAYVSNSGDATITPIDLRSRRAMAPIAVGVQPQGLAIDETGTTIYVADSGADTISVVDTRARRRTGVLRAGLNPQNVALSPDGATLYAAAMSDNACVKISIAHPASRSTIQVGNVPIALTLP